MLDNFELNCIQGVGNQIFRNTLSLTHHLEIEMPTFYSIDENLFTVLRKCLTPMTLCRDVQGGCGEKSTHSFESEFSVEFLNRLKWVVHTLMDARFYLIYVEVPEVGNYF